MSRTRQYVLTFLLAVVAATAGYFSARDRQAGQHAATQTLPTDPTAGARLVALELPDLTGRPQKLAQWQGKVLVVNYWATWCPPCREELPAFSRLSQQFAAKGVQFVGIGIDQADKMAEFQQVTPIPYPSLVGDSSALNAAAILGNPGGGLPFTVVLDRHGAVAHTRLGLQREDELRRLLETLTEKH